MGCPRNGYIVACGYKLEVMRYQFAVTTSCSMLTADKRINQWRHDLNQQVFWFIPYKSVGWFPCARKDATASPRKKHPTWFLTVSCPFSPVAFLPFSLFSFLLAPPILFHSLNRRDVYRYIPARCQRIQMDVFGDGQVAVQRLMDEILFPQRVNAGILMTSMTSNIFKKWLSISRQSRMSIILFFTFGLLSSNQVIIVAPTW